MAVNSMVEAIRAAVDKGEYARAAAIAAELAPGAEPQLEQFRIQMELFEEAKAAGNWQRALRSLADARMAGIAAGLSELEAITTERVYEIVKLYKGRRP